MRISSLHFVALLNMVLPCFAGEIVLYQSDTCSGYPLIFAAGTTTDCRLADQGVSRPLIYSASTSRNIGPSCAFNLYTDKKCQTLGAKITSSGPYKKCQAIAKGLVSYKITCTDPVSGTLVRPIPESDSASNSYFMPLVTYRNKPSGHTNFARLRGYGGSRSNKPTGSPSTTGTKLAAAFFSQVPANAQQFTVSIVDGGTLYKLTFAGDKGRNYTAESAARKMGQAAFASHMADTAALLALYPQAYRVYDLYDIDASDTYLGTVNITYVAP